MEKFWWKIWDIFYILELFKIIAYIVPFSTMSLSWSLSSPDDKLSESSRTSYSGDKLRCHQCGTDKQQNKGMDTERLSFAIWNTSQEIFFDARATLYMTSGPIRCPRSEPKWAKRGENSFCHSHHLSVSTSCLHILTIFGFSSNLCLVACALYSTVGLSSIVFHRSLISSGSTSPRSRSL